METFREEHYEVEAKLNSRWEVIGGNFLMFQTAKGFAESHPDTTRIIRCTTIREVVE